MTTWKLLLVPALLVGFIACGSDGENACYSPTSNPSLALQPSAVGCACDPAVDKDVCVQGAALVCVDGRWKSVLDGPCTPDAGSDRDSASPDLGAEPTSRSEVGDGPVDGAGQCYSPTSNLSLALQPSAVGCACDPAVDKDVCVQGAALVCMDGRWKSVLDGPCMPDAGIDRDSASPDSGAEAGDGGAEGGGQCFSPSSNLSLAGQPGAVGCACNHAVDQDVCVQGKALMCINGRWTFVYDGPCMPPPPRDAALDQNPADVASDRASTEAGTRCGDGTCQPGQYCVPGCIGTCYCPPVPDSGVCPNGPCTCGSGAGCAYVPFSSCSSTLPLGCKLTDAGVVECMCA